MFGTQDASYYIMTFDNGATVTALERNYTFTLNAEDGNIGMDSVDPSGF